MAGTQESAASWTERRGTVVPFQPSRAGLPASCRVVVVSRHRLVAEAIRASLVVRRLPVRVETLVEPRWPPGPDELVVLLDELESRRGVDAVVELVRSSGRVLVLTGHARGAVWGAPLAAGAVAVTSSGSTVDGLEAMVRATARGEALMDPAERESLEQEWEDWLAHERSLERQMSGLTDREATVLLLLAHGTDVRSISVRLGVGVETVRSQVKSVRRKLRSPTQLAAVALVHEWATGLPAD